MKASTRCQDCGCTFQSEQVKDEGLCPKCQAFDDRMYAIDRMPDFTEDRPWPWSKAAMRERLGVTGDVDE